MIRNMKAIALQYPVLLLIYSIEVILLAAVATAAASPSSSSDVLMIRHGRSRVRHSTEKSHIRWGLQAFDNFTLIEYDYENPNGTNATYDVPYDVTGVGNQSMLDANSLMSAESVDVRPLSTSMPWHRSMSQWTPTSASTSSVPHKKLAKKQIMESIRKDVNAGVEYLRTHAHLSVPTVSMPELRTIMLRKIGKPLNKAAGGMSLAPDDAFFVADEPIQADDASVAGAADTSSPIDTRIDKSELSLDANRSEITDKHHLNGNDGKTNLQPNNRRKVSSSKRNGTIGAAAVATNDRKSNKNLNQSVSDQKTGGFAASHSDFNERQATGDDFGGHSRNPNDDDEQMNDTRHEVFGSGGGASDLPFSPSGLYSSAEANDEAAPGPDAIEEQTINLEINDELGDTVSNQHQIDYIDLDDLDDISRNNRLKMKKGSDVLTRFLEIVESQHLLGANCTAGTALNLGEGVVDQYAQDRFRTTAEVAVNRANMLTR